MSWAHQGMDSTHPPALGGGPGARPAAWGRSRLPRRAAELGQATAQTWGYRGICFHKVCTF